MYVCMYFSVELNVDAREKSGELYCLRCHDKMGIPICGACRSVQRMFIAINTVQLRHMESYSAKVSNENSSIDVLNFSICN